MVGKSRVILSVFHVNLTGFEGCLVVAQLVERSLLAPEISGSNLNIGKILSTNCTFKKNR